MNVHSYINQIREAIKVFQPNIHSQNVTLINIEALQESFKKYKAWNEHLNNTNSDFVLFLKEACCLKQEDEQDLTVAEKQFLS